VTTAESRDGYRVGLAGWVLPGVVVLLAVAVLVGPGLIGGLAGSDSASPTPSGPDELPDSHEFDTDEGLLSFQYEDGAIIVRRTAAGQTVELGRSVPLLSIPSGGQTLAPAGNALFVLVCGPSNGPDSRRYVFGRVDPVPPVTYDGPEAVGLAAADGLYLFALLPGDVDPDAVFGVEAGRVGLGDPTSLVRAPATMFERAVENGRREPSGCYVYG